ncbi:hypothetical protein QTP70_031778, partial [Hemibagrus guttatus]
VLPLIAPTVRVTVSNVPLFISNEEIEQGLMRYEKLEGEWCSWCLKTIVFKFTVDGFDYNIFVSSDADMRCFKFGKTKHLVRACPER